MPGACPNTGVLMLEVPVGPAKVLNVSGHAVIASFERVVRPKSAREEAEAELEVSNRSTGHGCRSCPKFPLREEGGVERKQRLILRQH